MHALLLLLALTQAAPAPQTGGCTTENLVGTWRIVEADGQPRPDDYPVHKHVTPTHFVVIEWDTSPDRRAVRTHAGPHTVANGRYRESIVYGFGARYDQLSPAVRQAGVEWACSRSGDDWRIEGTILGTARRETWRRVTAAP